ncbi:hypothetical protein OROMI_013201 [Orobanche minor]
MLTVTSEKSDVGDDSGPEGHPVLYEVAHREWLQGRDNLAYSQGGD